MKTRTLYRPVGVKELRLMLDLNMRAFPPRLDWQPIFYPVLTFSYAEQIARDWNTRDPNSDYARFVTAFDLDAEYLNQFEVRTVGTATHQELWIPAEDLQGFNTHITGFIRVEAAYFGEQYKVERLPDNFYTSLKSGIMPQALIEQYRAEIFLNWLYWQADTSRLPGTPHNTKTNLRQRIQATWPYPFPLPMHVKY